MFVLESSFVSQVSNSIILFVLGYFVVLCSLLSLLFFAIIITIVRIVMNRIIIFIITVILIFGTINTSIISSIHTFCLIKANGQLVILTCTVTVSVIFIAYIARYKICLQMWFRYTFYVEKCLKMCDWKKISRLTFIFYSNRCTAFEKLIFGDTDVHLSRHSH